MLWRSSGPSSEVEKCTSCSAANRSTRSSRSAKFVAMTNGDIGHFEMAGGPLARRRKAEVEECARILGIETEVLRHACFDKRW